jgi:hypothetical protein
MNDNYDYTMTAQVLAIAATCGKNINYKENNKFHHFFLVAHAIYAAKKDDGKLSRRVNIYYHELKEYLRTLDTSTRPQWYVDLIDELEIKFKT